MPPDGGPGAFAIHATAVAIGDRALLIQGPSRSGKSRLASDLMARSTRARPIMLVGDDRILLETTAAGMVARPHPRIAGFIERRGLGLCATAYRDQARVTGLVDFGTGAATHRLLANFPAFMVVGDATRACLCDAVLRWFDMLESAARAPQVGAKAGDDARGLVKD